MGFIASLALKLSPVGAFLKRLNLSQIALIAMCALCLFLKLSLASEQRHSAKLQGQLIASVEGRKADRAAYVAAQDAAAAKNKAEVARIETQQEYITNDISKDYASDLARLRSELGRVREQGRTNSRTTSGANPGTDGKAAQGVDGDGVQVCPADNLPAAEIELRLMHLQNWVEEQGKVQR